MSGYIRIEAGWYAICITVESSGDLYYGKVSLSEALKTICFKLDQYSEGSQNSCFGLAVMTVDRVMENTFAGELIGGKRSIGGRQYSKRAPRGSVIFASADRKHVVDTMNFIQSCQDRSNDIMSKILTRIELIREQFAKRALAASRSKILRKMPCLLELDDLDLDDDCEH